ncbi:sulfite exporter TauE/SafE family protein [Thalassolituus hydrocarboniclasticus]
MMTFLLFLAVGSVAGLLAGLFGIGGGMVIVPVLVITFAAQGVSEAVLTHMAVATSLATIVFTSLSSVREHHRQGAVDWTLVGVMSIGIVLGTMLGVSLITAVPGPLLQKIIGVFALLLAAKMFFGLEPKGAGKRPGNRGLIMAGSVVGFGSSWFGIGGGTFTVPYLSWMKIPMRQAVATSAACGLPIALTGAISNVAAGWNHADLPEWSTGFLYWPAIIGIVLTSVPFAKVGAKLAHRLDQALLKKGFALLLCAVGIKFLLF